MAVFNNFVYDNINSLDFGVYITGEAVYNAPECIVNMVDIPGRNGALAIDEGRFANIQVTYLQVCSELIRQTSRIRSQTSETSSFRDSLTGG